MNKFYKVVFCKTTGVMKAVSETAKSGKKTKSVSVVATALAVGLMSATSANAAIEDDVATNTAIIGQHTQALEQINGALEEVGQLSQNITQAGLIVGTADINEGSMAVGAEAVASGDSAIAVGNQANVKGVQGLAVGSYNDVTGRQSTAIGSNNTIRGIEEWWNDELFTQESQRSTLIGVENNLTGNESIAIGVYNRANNNNVTITGSRNSVDARESGAYGQGNFVGSERVIPTFLRVDDGAELRRVPSDEAELRMVPSYAIQSGSYAYGNMNEVIGDKSHAVGNSNNVMGESNGVLGNGNTLSNDTMFIEPPRWDVRTANMERVLNQDSNGSFLVGNQNDVRANNTHAVGNQNTIRNDRNVTIGNSNRVEFLEEPIFIQPQRMSLNNDTSTAIVGEEPVFIQPQRIGMIGNNNTSTAIVGEGNNIYAAGVHIVGTENSVDQAYSYVVGAGNTVELPFMPPMMMAGELGMGSNVFGSRNYTESEKSLVLGDGNYIEQNSLLAVVTGSENNISGVSSSTVGNNNQIRKDVGGAHGTMNSVRGNTGALRVINDTLEAYNSGEIEVFEGLDLDDDGVVDFATVEDFMLMVNQSGSYAYGNINNIQGEGVHTVGNNNEFSGNNNKGVGNNNRIGQVGGMVGNSDAVLPTVKFYDSAAYGDLNIVNADSAQAIGNKNSLEKDFSSITGYSNTVTQGLDGELVDVTIEQQRLAGTFVSGNDNLIESHGGHVSGSGNEFQADRATLSGSENTVIGNEGHVVGNDNSVYGSSNNGFGNNNVIGKVMSGDYSSVDSSHVVGNNNTMEGNLSSAFGNENKVTGDETSVIGLSNTTDGIGNLVLGNYNENQSSLTTMVGGYNNIDDNYSDNAVAVGQNNSLSGNQAAAFGNKNSIEKDASGAIGVENYIADGFDSDGLAGQGLNGMGDAIDYNKYIERGSYAQGNKNDVRGDTTHVYGYQNGVLGNKASVMGANNSVSGNGTQVIGNDNTIGYNNDGMPQYGDNIAVLGSSNTVEAENSFVVGSNSVVDRGADGSLVFGSNASSSVQNGVAIGNGATVGRENTVSFGSAGEERQLTNVADATETKDAVNLGQLNASLRDTTAGKNIAVKRTDTGYEVSTVEDMTLTSVATGNTTINNAGFTNGATTVGSTGLKVGDVTVSNAGLDNAGNRVTSVGDATLRSDAVNYGQFTDGLAGTIKSVTGDENITATTDAEKNVSLVLNKNLVADSLTTGTTVINTDGVRAGDVFLSSTTGLDNAGNRVTGVGTAIEGTDAVNFDQFKAGLTDTTAGKNIAVKRTDTGYEVSTIEDMTLTSVTTGNTVIDNAGFTNGATTVGSTGLKVGDVTVSNIGLDNAGNRVTSVGDATLRSDAVNYGQFQDGMAGTIKSVTGDENITATTDAEKNVSLVLNKDLVADSLTAGDTVINNAGFTNGATTVGNTGLQVGDVTVASTGLDNAGNRVTSVGDATLRSDAVNYGQFQDGLAGTIKSVTGDENITATTDAEKNVSLVLNKNLVADSLTTGTTIINTDGVRAGDVFMSSASGLNNAGFTVSGVGDAVERDEAINKGQFDDATKDMITSVDSADDNIYVNRDGGSVWVGMSNNISVESVSTGGGSLDAFGLTVGSVNISKESGISAGNKKVTGVANAVNRDEAINKGQFDDALEGIAHTTVDGDSNIVATKNETGYDLSLSKDVTVDSVTAGENVLNSGGLTVGGVTVNGETGIYAGDMTVSGVRDAVNADDAVNLGQVSAIDDRLTAENVKQDGLIESNTTRITKNTAAIDKGFSVGDGETANKFELGDTVNITADSNTKTTTTENGVELGLADNITIDSVTTGNALLNTDGLRVGDAMYGASGMRVGDVYFGPTGVRAGDVILSNTSGLNNAGFTVSGVGNAINRDEAVNKGQLDDALDGIQHTTVTGDANINATKNDTGYDLSLNKDLTVDSVTTGNTVVNGNGVAVGDVTLGSNGLNNGGNKVTGVAAATEGSDAVNLDQFNAALNDIAPTDIKGDENITVSKGSNGYEIGLSKDVAVDSVNAGGTIIDSNGVTVGDVTLGANGLNNAGNTITGVGAGVKDDDAVNMGQLNATNAKVDKNTADITATNDRITVETGRLDAVNAAQDKVIAGKLDREEFLQDQQRQDEAIKGKADQAELDKTNVNVSNNTTNIDKNAADIKDHATELDRLEDVKADKADLDKTNANVSNNTTNIDKNAADIKDHATELDRLEDVKADKADLDKTNENVTANADKNKDQDKTLSDHQTELERLEDKKADKADIDAKADTDYVDKAVSNKVEEQSSYFNEKVSNYEAQIKRDMETMQKDQAKVDTAQDVRIDANTQMINDLGYKVDNMEDKLSAGIASSVAMALMPNAINPGEVRLAGGTGYYNGENAIAVGLTGATESGAFTYKIAGSYTDTGGAVVGGGISYRVW